MEFSEKPLPEKPKAGVAASPAIAKQMTGSDKQHKDCTFYMQQNLLKVVYALLR